MKLCLRKASNPIYSAPKGIEIGSLHMPRTVRLIFTFQTVLNAFKESYVCVEKTKICISQRFLMHIIVFYEESSFVEFHRRIGTFYLMAQIENVKGVNNALLVLVAGIISRHRVKIISIYIKTGL